MKKPDYTVDAVIRSLEVLEALAEAKGGIGVVELSKRSKINVSRAFRLLNTLAQRGFAERDPETGRYHVGVRVFELGMARLHHWSFRDIAVPFLKQLHEKTGETVFLGVLRDTEVLIIDSLSHPQGIAFRTQIGVAEPLYCTGIGKALLAHLPQPAREDILKKIHLKRWTEYTIRSKTALRRELFIVQRQGYAVDRGEHSPGVQCIGVPIFDHQSLVVGSFSIAGPDVRMNERIKDFADLAMSVGRKISRGLGYSDFRTMAVASSK